LSKVAVIGSGFAGLSAAISLAAEGHNVTVLEKNSTAGGRARRFESEGYVFDMGPSWYWMPDVFERFFARFGRKPSDYYDLIRLDPSYRIFFSASDAWDIPASPEGLYGLFEKVEPGSGSKLKSFLEESRFKYEIGMNDLVYKPGLSLTELLDPRVISGALRLHVFKSLSRYVRSRFTDPRLVQLLEFPVLFLGSTPDRTPALYSLMNYADMSLGTWYPMGGMSRVVDAFVRLAIELGITFRFQCEVTGFGFADRRIVSAATNQGDIPTDVIVAGADYRHVESLLPAGLRKYSDTYWNTRKMAPSSLLFYLGINKKLRNLRHHTLFFDRDFAQHAYEIYDSPKWPTDPLFYVSVPSVTDPSVAPEGCEAMVVLIPVASGITGDAVSRERYFHLVMDRMEALTGQSIRDSVVLNRSYAHDDFIRDYHAFKGNAYGLANTLLQTANLRPSIVNPKVSNLFYTGQLTVPGPGVPPAVISGQVVARHILNTKRNPALV
jgi:phytoene desaturase